MQLDQCNSLRPPFSVWSDAVFGMSEELVRPVRGRSRGRSGLTRASVPMRRCSGAASSAISRNDA